MFAAKAVKSTTGASEYRQAQARLEAAKLRDNKQDKLDYANRIEAAKPLPPPVKPPLLLPVTRNLYELNQWRKKHGLPLDGSQDPKQVATKSSTTKETPSKPTASTSASASKPTVKKAKPTKALPALPPTREEKEAARRAALFDDDDDRPSKRRRNRDEEETSTGMLLARMGRALLGEEGGDDHRRDERLLGRPATSKEVESARRGLSLGSTRMIKKSSKSSSSSSSSSSANAIASGSGSAAMDGGVLGGSAKDRLKAAFKQGELRKLNLQKNDKRTIEEVERDMKLRRAGAMDSASPAPSSKGTNRSAANSTSTTGTALDKKRPRTDSAINSGPSTSFYASSSANSTGKSSTSNATKSAAYTEAHSLPPRPVKISNNTNKLLLSREIQEIMRGGRPARAPVNGGTRTYFKGDRGRWDEEDSDSGSDMEGTHDEVMREEEYARRIAEEEDAREDARLRAAAERKRSRQ